MRGEGSISELINLSESERKKMKRRSIRPKDCAYISPLDCLKDLVKKYDTHVADNIHLMCVSFVLKNTNELNIKGYSSAEVLTNHIFTKRKKRKSKTKKDISRQEDEMNGLEDQLGYHLTNEGQLPMFGLVLDPRQAKLTQKMEKQFVVNLFNFNSEDIVLYPNTNICKIYIYVLERQT